MAVKHDAKDAVLHVPLCSMSMQCQPSRALDIKTILCSRLNKGRVSSIFVTRRLFRSLLGLIYRLFLQMIHHILVQPPFVAPIRLV